MNEDNKHDALKEVFQRNLENHRIPVDSSDWEKINNRLHGKSSPKKKLFVLWGAVAASLAIILTLTYRFEGGKIREINDFKNNIVAASKEVESSQSNQVEETVTIFKFHKESKYLKYFKDAKDSIETLDNTEQETIIIYQEELKKEESEKRPTEKQINKSQNNTLFATDYPSIKKRKKNELLLAASFGTNRGMGNNTTIHNSDYANSRPGENPSLNNGINSFPNNKLISSNTDGEYSPPLSFGLSIRKNLNSHWGIETGLVYTYLSSTYRWNDRTAVDATQQLHYLGVPLNGVVYLWNNNPKWNVYLSFGAMLEKGLWMKTTRKEHWNYATVSTTQKSDIDGWQWSLNSSLGISYRFADKMELYIEPRFSYFFDNNQPMSIRTDWPVSVGVGGGLRYSF